MPLQITYSNSSFKIKTAVTKANAILASTRLYSIIRARTEPFTRCTPSDLSPAAIADLLQSATIQPLLRELKTFPQFAGRFASKYPKVMWINLNGIDAKTTDAIAAFLVQLSMYIVNGQCTNCNFASEDLQPAQGLDTAPYWVQQQIRENFFRLPSEHLTSDNLLFVETKSTTSIGGDYYAWRKNKLDL